MTLVDWIIVALIVAAVFGGFAQGFFRSACALGGLLLGLVLAAWNYGRISHLLTPLIRIEAICDALGFLLIAVAVMAIAGFIGSLLTTTAEGIGLGCLNRFAGGIFGFFLGMMLVTIGILITVAFFPQTHWLTESRLPRQFFAACHLSTNISPEGLSQRVRHELKLLQSGSPKWMHPGTESPGRN